MKNSLFCLFLLIILFLPVCSARAWQQNVDGAESNNPETAEIAAPDAVLSLNPENDVVRKEITDLLRADHESFFPIRIVNDSFSQQVDAVLKNIDPDSLMRVVSEYGQQDIDLFVNTDMIHDHIGKINFDLDYPKNFEISVDVNVRDVYPQSRGGCYIGFSEKGMSNNTDPAEYYFVTDGKNVMFYCKTENSSSGELFPIDSVSEGIIKLSVTHLTGHVFLWVNDACVGQFHDGNYGKLRLSYGALTLNDGETACCSFDNLSIRKVGSE